MARLTLELTEAEANALYGAASAGEVEWCDTVSHDSDRSSQQKAAALAALERAMAKLRAV